MIFFEFVETLVVNFVKPMNDEENRDSFFINSSPQTVINSTDLLTDTEYVPTTDYG